MAEMKNLVDPVHARSVTISISVTRERCNAARAMETTGYWVRSASWCRIGDRRGFLIVLTLGPEILRNRVDCIVHI